MSISPEKLKDIFAQAGHATEAVRNTLSRAWDNVQDYAHFIRYRATPAEKLLSGGIGLNLLAVGGWAVGMGVYGPEVPGVFFMACSTVVAGVGVAASYVSWRDDRGMRARFPHEP